MRGSPISAWLLITREPVMCVTTNGRSRRCGRVGMPYRRVPEPAVVHRFALRLLVFELPDQLALCIAQSASEVGVLGDRHQLRTAGQARPQGDPLLLAAAVLQGDFDVHPTRIPPPQIGRASPTRPPRADVPSPRSPIPRGGRVGDARAPSGKVDPSRVDIEVTLQDRGGKEQRVTLRTSLPGRPQLVAVAENPDLTRALCDAKRELIRQLEHQKSEREPMHNHRLRGATIRHPDTAALPEITRLSDASPVHVLSATMPRWVSRGRRLLRRKLLRKGSSVPPLGPLPDWVVRR